MRDERVRGTHGDRPRSSRSALGRASDAQPPRLYVAGERAARQEPPEVTAARERHRALNAELVRRRAALDARIEALAKAVREARERDG